MENNRLTQVKRLTPAEYPSLAELGDGYTPDPRTSVTIVAKDGSEVVGRIFLLCPVHVEGPWVREDRRGGHIGAKLIRAAEEEAKRAGVQKLLAYGASEQLENYLVRLGYTRTPFTVWEKQLSDSQNGEQLA